MRSRPRLPTRPPDGAVSRDGDMSVQEALASVVDVAFNIEGSSVPAEHDWPLLRAVEERLPWFAGEPLAGIHPLRTVPTSYGVALLAQRAKLVLRLPAVRLPDALLLQDTDVRRRRRCAAHRRGGDANAATQRDAVRAPSGHQRRR